MRLRWIDVGQSVLMVILEEERPDMAASDFLVVERELGIDHVAPDHASGSVK